MSYHGENSSWRRGSPKTGRFTATLTPANEVSELQLASFKRHKRNGTTPGNPKWYRPRTIRPFVPQLSVHVPKIESGQEWHNKHSTSRPDPFHQVRGFDGQEYVLAYERALGLKSLDVAARAAFDKLVEPVRRAA